MVAQQDILATGSENRPSMLSKDDYVQWSSRIICYCKSKPNGKIIAKSMLKGPYQYKQFLKTSDDTTFPPLHDTYKLQNDTNFTKTERKQVEANDQVIHILLLGLPTDVYDVVGSCQIANEM
nr:hypothetical protein [Tanacetum cinerariifolium]